MTYKEMYYHLKGVCKDAGVGVRLVSSKSLLDFAGIHSKLADEWNFKTPWGTKMPKNTIYIKKSLPWSGRYHTLNHEMVEIGLMDQGLDYWPAHEEATKLERFKLVGAEYINGK